MSTIPLLSRFAMLLARKMPGMKSMLGKTNLLAPQLRVVSGQIIVHIPQLFGEAGARWHSALISLNGTHGQYRFRVGRQARKTMGNQEDVEHVVYLMVTGLHPRMISIYDIIPQYDCHIPPLSDVEHEDWRGIPVAIVKSGETAKGLADTLNRKLIQQITPRWPFPLKVAAVMTALVVGVFMVDTSPHQDVIAEVTTTAPSAQPNRPVLSTEQLTEMIKNAAPYSIKLGAKSAPPEKTAYLFSDPLCPYCIEQEAIIAAHPDWSITVFPVGFRPGSHALIDDALCAKDPASAWMAMMTGAPVAGVAAGKSCAKATGKEINVTLFRSLGLTVTPSMILGTGQILHGLNHLN